MRNTWELTSEEFERLPAEQKSIYREAAVYMDNDIAGGYDGWVRGMELLESIGWTRQRRSEGHRTFVSMHKPAALEAVITENQ